MLGHSCSHWNSKLNNMTANTLMPYKGKSATFAEYSQLFSDLLLPKFRHTGMRIVGSWGWKLT